MQEQKNIFDDIPTSLPEEIIEVLANKGSVRIERIISKGHASPEGFWYNQKEDELVLLLSGSAELLFADEDRVVELLPGDYILIPSHQRHRVMATDPDEESVWLAIYF